MKACSSLTLEQILQRTGAGPSEARKCYLAEQGGTLVPRESTWPRTPSTSLLTPSAAGPSYLEFVPGGVPQNANFYDVRESTWDNHLIIENGWDEAFAPASGAHVEGLSIIGDSDIVDVSFVATRFPALKALLIRSKGIVGVDALKFLQKLEVLSLDCQRNAELSLDLPGSLKRLTITWKPKYRLLSVHPALEAVSIDKGYGVDWGALFGNGKNLVKVDIMDSDLTDGGALLSLKSLRFLSLTNCRSVAFPARGEENHSAQYLCFKRVPVPALDWVTPLRALEVLILEGCGSVRELAPVSSLERLRGLVLSGNTRVENGDLTVLESLKQLQNCFIVGARHYTHRSLFPWNWRNFDSPPRMLIERK